MTGEKDHSRQNEALARADADHDLLVRIDERTKNWEQALKTFVTKEEHKTLHELVESKASSSEVVPIRNIVYGMVSLALVAVFGAIIVNVIK